MSARPGPPSKKRPYHHGDLARALVAATVERIAKVGPESFTLREVAAAVGVTHGAAYRHFADKGALLAAVAEEGFRTLTARLAVARSASITDAAERLRVIGAAYVGFALANPSHYEVMWGPRLNEDGRFPSLEAAVGEAFDLLVHEFERGQLVGALRSEPARDLAVGFWVAANGYVELVLRGRIKVKSDAVAIAYFEKLLVPFLDGLAPRKRPRKAPLSRRQRP